MRKRIIGAILVIGLLTAGLGFLYVSLEFYFLFPTNSDRLFQWKHKWVDHLEMHTDRWSYQPGEIISVMISNAKESEVEILLFGVGENDTLYQGSHFASYQPLPDSAAIYGTQWKPSFQLPLSENMSTGWYILQVKRADFTRSTTVMVTPRSKVNRSVALLLSTNTWNAYNHWGGFSIYSPNHTPTLSFQRPQLLADPYIENTYPNHQLYYQAANKDVYLADLMDSLQIPFDVYPMEALHEGVSQLCQYQTLIISTHSEYWTNEMLNHLNGLLDSGLNFLNLAGNVAAYRTFLDAQSGQMTVYREIPELWEMRDSTRLRPFGTQPSFMGFHTYAPYTVMLDSSWIFEGTHLEEGELFGDKSDTYDYTYMYASWWENLLGLQNKGKMGAAAGLEIDIKYQGTPKNWITIASGLNPVVEGHGEVYPESLPLSWEGGKGAEMGYYIHSGGGIVFSVGSMSFTGAIPYDPHIQTIIKNLLK